MDYHTFERSPILRTSSHVYDIPSGSSDSLGPGELSSSEILALYKENRKSEKCDTKKQSSLITIFSVWNTIMGSSLLTMAWGIERAGLVLALLLMIFMGALCLYTAYILIKVKENHAVEVNGSCEVPALCRALLGKGTSVLAHTFSMLVLVGSNIVYWILITNFLYFSVNYLYDLNATNSTALNETLLCPSEDIFDNRSLIIPEPLEEKNISPYWNLHTTVPIYVAIIVYPLLNFKNASFFTKFNSLGTLSVMYLLVFVAVKGWKWGINVLDGAPIGKDAAVLSGMLALSFYIHNIIITIMNGNKNQEKNGRDLSIAFILVTVTYTFVGVIFYICFPLAKSCIEDNMLNNFEMHDVMTAVARALLLFQVVTVYPLVAFMLRTEALLLLPTRNKQSQSSILVINAFIVVICILVACFCPNIGNIIRYTGALSGLVHIFALPSLLQIKSLKLREKLTWWKTIFYFLIIMFGAINLIMQFFITEKIN